MLAIHLIVLNGKQLHILLTCLSNSVFILRVYSSSCILLFLQILSISSIKTTCTKHNVINLVNDTASQVRLFISYSLFSLASLFKSWKPTSSPSNIYLHIKSCSLTISSHHCSVLFFFYMTFTCFSSNFIISTNKIITIKYRMQRICQRFLRISTDLTFWF